MTDMASIISGLFKDNSEKITDGPELALDFQDEGKAEIPHKTLRMSSEAKEALKRAKEDTGRAMGVIFLERIKKAEAARFKFSQSDFGGHDSKATFNVKISGEYVERLKKFAELRQVTFSALLSAAILKG